MRRGPSPTDLQFNCLHLPTEEAPLPKPLRLRTGYRMSALGRKQSLKQIKSSGCFPVDHFQNQTVRSRPNCRYSLQAVQASASRPQFRPFRTDLVLLGYGHLNHT